MKKIYRIILLISVIFTFQGCEDALVENPKSFLTPKNAFLSPGNINAFTTSAYAELSQLSHRQRAWFMYTDLYSDDSYYPKSKAERKNCSNIAPTAEGSENNRLYRDFYDLIGSSNVVLLSLQDADGDPDVINLGRGQLRFLRAYGYFNLLHLYGSVPLFDENNFNNPDISETIGREPTNNLYQFIIDDLTFAIENLPWEYESDDLGRVTKGAALMLLAKTYLAKATSGDAAGDDYQNALANTTKIITEGGYSLMPDYEKLFWASEVDANTETIFFVDSYVGAPDNLRARFITNILPNPGNYDPDLNYRGPGFGNWQVTSSLFNSFDDNDVRKGLIVDGEYTSDNGVTLIQSYLWTFKFADPGVAYNRNDTGTPWIFFRYADLLLMHAEIRQALFGADAEALEKLNMVRTRSGLEELSGLSSEELRDEIRNERRRELYFEGHRTFDLRRWKMLEVVNDVEEKTADVMPHNYLLPIPAGRITANVPQNPGY